MIMQVHPLTCKAQNRPKRLICFDREGINVLQFLSMEFGQPFFLVILSSRKSVIIFTSPLSNPTNLDFDWHLICFHIY